MHVRVQSILSDVEILLKRTEGNTLYNNVVFPVYNKQDNNNNNVYRCAHPILNSSHNPK